MSKHSPFSGETFHDYDLLSQIAKTDEKRFEKIRQDLIDEFISSAPDDKKVMLARTQWKIDQIRQLSKNPVDAYLKISSLMWDSLIELSDKQIKLVATISGESDTTIKPDAPQRAATILPFRHTENSEK